MKIRTLVVAAAIVSGFALAGHAQTSAPRTVVYAPTDGSAPTTVAEVPPRYTPDAMRARIQGTILLQATVLSDGTVGDVKVARPLDPIFGLDQQAVLAMKSWQFRPGLKDGKPVGATIYVEMAFVLR